MTEEIRAGDLVEVLHKLLNNAGEVYDVIRVVGQVLSVDFSFANKYPYEVKLRIDGKDKISVFNSSEIKFYDRLKEEPSGAKKIVITEATQYIEWTEDWIDDHQF